MAVYGVKWHSDATSPTLDRLESNVGLTAGTSFNTLSPWTMRRCNLWTDGTPTAYYGDRCYTDTDVVNMGQVMVQIPKFWYAIDISLANHVAFYISNTGAEVVTNLSGGGNITWAVHPAFIVGGTPVTYAYVGAFEAYQNGSDFESKGLVTPSNTITPATARTVAEHRGTGWELMTIQALSALKLLYIVEYASLSSDLIGYGRCQDVGALDTGYTGLGGPVPSGNASYGDPVTAHYHTPMSYRGVENLWGDLNTLMEGIIVKLDDMPWIAPQSRGHTYSFASPTGAPYVDTTVTLGASGYIKDVYTDPAALGSTAANWAFLPKTTTGGSATTYLCDHWARLDGLRVVVAGGAYDSGTVMTGLFYLAGAWQAGGVSNVGFRTQYLPSA